jgi:hypothetical protein
LCHEIPIGQSGWSTDDTAFAHDEDHSRQRLDVAKRIAVHRDDVRGASGCNSPDVVFPAEYPRGVDRRGSYDLDDRQARIDPTEMMASTSLGRDPRSLSACGRSLSSLARFGMSAGAPAADLQARSTPPAAMPGGDFA